MDKIKLNWKRKSYIEIFFYNDLFEKKKRGKKRFN